MNYFESTQIKNWVFTQELIDKTHISKFEKGLTMMKEIYKNQDPKINKKSIY